MKTCLLIILALSFLTKVEAQVMWQVKNDSIRTWNYSWGDEFNGNEIDAKKWLFWYGWTRSIYSNKEQQYYTDGKNHKEENGTLSLVARKEPLDARMTDWLPDTDSLKVGNKFYGLNRTHFNYTSGLIKSAREFKYGYFEMRFKAPKDKGMWPAFWLYGGDPNEEIDIMEIKGERPSQTHVAIHYINEDRYSHTWYGKKRSWGDWLKLSGSLQDGFNVVAGEWQPGLVKFYMNGKCIALAKIPFNVPKCIAANMAIASNNGPFNPGPDGNFTQSDPFVIDYIRVWTLPGQEEKEIKKSNLSVSTQISGFPQKTVSLKKKNKYLYGKKSQHAKEGMFVSLFPVTKWKYILYQLGNEKKEEVKIELLSDDQKVVFSQNCKDFETELDFSQLPKSKYKLIVHIASKTAEQAIDLN